ncbi:hypothetical protein, partial [Thomasclavelia cocleata]|uniref:hypothetical protein n=1 Tax=Thomasclavelia cocleata TaxID=69824 RepID=UPI0025779390
NNQDNIDINKFCANQTFKSMYLTKFIHTYTNLDEDTLKFTIFHNDKFNSNEITKIQKIYKNIFQIIEEDHK